MNSQDEPNPLHDVASIVNSPEVDENLDELGPPPSVTSLTAVDVEFGPCVGTFSTTEESLMSGLNDRPPVFEPSKQASAPAIQTARPHILQVTQSDPSLGPDTHHFWQEVQNDVDKALKEVPSDESVKSLTRQLRDRLSCPYPQLLAFDGHRSGPNEQFIQIRGPLSESVWFIGDLHGDLLSFVSLCNFIRAREVAEKSTEAYKICFLGDIVDRGPYDIQLLWTFFHRLLAHPNRFAFVVGNHDDGIYRDVVSKQWRSTVDPSDFCDRLNIIPPESPFHELVVEAVRFFSQAPRAILFPGGLLVAHGGVPHVDLLQQLKEPEDLNGPLMLSDFIWTRLHESARRKVPNRNTRGCSLGYEDFNAFCDRAATILDLPITSMLRGHDHVAERFLIHDRYPRRSVVTINAMCSKQTGDIFGPFERKPVAARWREGNPLEIFQLEIPVKLINHYYSRLSMHAVEDASATTGTS